MPYNTHTTIFGNTVWHETWTYLTLQSHDILAGFIFADVVLDGAHPGGIGEGVGALINIVVRRGHIHKHECLGASSQGVTHQHGELVIPATSWQLLASAMHSRCLQRVHERPNLKHAAFQLENSSGM